MKLKGKSILYKILQRLIKIGTPTSGSRSLAVPANTSTAVNTISIPAGTWLLLSFMDLAISISGKVYNHYLVGKKSGVNTFGRVVRSPADGGGGSVNWFIVDGSSTSVVEVQTYVTTACTVRTSYSLIYLGGGST